MFNFNTKSEKFFKFKNIQMGFRKKINFLRNDFNFLMLSDANKIENNFSSFETYFFFISFKFKSMEGKDLAIFGLKTLKKQ